MDKLHTVYKITLEIVVGCSRHKLAGMQRSQSAVRHRVVTRRCNGRLRLASPGRRVEGPWRTGEAGLSGRWSTGSGSVEPGSGQHRVERGRQAVASSAGEQRSGDVRRQTGFVRVDPRRQEERRCR